MCEIDSTNNLLPMDAFVRAKMIFDAKHKGANKTECIVPVNGKSCLDVDILNTKGEFNEEYYKWQFINALVNSGMYSRDYICVEIQFPKGNKKSATLKIDAAIFDDPSWLIYYNRYQTDKKSDDLEWLGSHLLAVCEFKKGDKEIEKVFSGQVKAAMREKEPSNAFVLGVYYDTERLYLFQRKNGVYIRYDESKNQKGDNSKVGDLSLYLPDRYSYIPSFKELCNRVNRPAGVDLSKRGIFDLEVITSISSVQIQTALSEVLRALDKSGLVDQRGYTILIQTLALKISDEKRNESRPQKHLEFFVSDVESNFQGLAEEGIQNFIKRMKEIREDASVKYRKILKNQDIDWKKPNHVRAVGE